MNYRLATLFPRTSYSADKTEPIDIDVVDPISALVIVYEPVNGSQAYGDGHPIRCLTNIEIVDGSDVLFSLSGAEAQAAAYYNSLMEPAGSINYLNGMTSEAVVNIFFGRFLWDTLYALDPTKFSNLKLNISIDIDAGGSNCASGYLRVLAHMFDQKRITPNGFFMYKEIKSFTLANSSHEYTNLPLENYPYRKLFIRAQRYEYGPDIQIDNVKLTEDVDKKVVVNHTMYNILWSMTNQQRPYREAILLPGNAAAQYFYCTPGYWPLFTAAGWRATIGGGDKNCYYGSGGRFQYVQTASGPNACVHCEGWAPHSTVELPFGIQGDPSDWYDVSGLGNLKLDITAGSSVGTSQTCEIFLQQARTY